MMRSGQKCGRVDPDQIFWNTKGIKRISRIKRISQIRQILAQKCGPDPPLADAPGGRMT